MTVEIWRARLVTRNFHFEAFGSSRHEATVALNEGFRLHAIEYEIADKNWHEEYAEEIDIRPMELGAVYRDCEKIVRRERKAVPRSRRNLFARTWE